MQVEGQNQLKREIEGCKNIPEKNRIFYINAIKKNTETGEEEMGEVRETIEEKFDKRLFY